MRILGLALAGALALAAPIAVHSASLGSIGQAVTGPVPGVMQVGDTSPIRDRAVSMAVPMGHQ
jgi:hypothetical protein